MNSYDTPGIGPDQFLLEVMRDLEMDMSIRVQAANFLGHLLQLRRPVRPPGFVQKRYPEFDLFDAGPHDHHFKVLYDPTKDLHQRIDAADALMHVGLGDFSPVKQLQRIWDAGYTLTELNEMLVMGHA
jgi:hypothetical protein